MGSSRKRGSKKNVILVKKFNFWLAVFLFGLGVALIETIILATVSIRQLILEERHKQRLADSISFCESLFDETTAINQETTKDDLTECNTLLNESTKEDEKDQVAKLHEQIENAFEYLAWMDVANEYIDENGIVKDSTQEKDVADLSEKIQQIDETYQSPVTNKFNFIKSEYDKMRDAEDHVNSLFTSIDRTNVRTNVVRSEYNNAKSRTDDLKQENLKNSLNESLEKVLPVIEEQERIARERAEAARRAREEEQRKIASSWHRLDIGPYYINQFDAGIKNGCEAASLLMAAKYKGYLRSTDFRSFALNMPTSETDPNQGFYLSMTDLEPRTEAHWIAPAPLASYGAGSGISVANVSGASIDQLDNEVKNGNPVVIYLTYGFRDPKEYSKGVPKNLHVVVLSGFNSYTGEQQFYDPWPGGSGTNPSLSKGRTEYLYNASGRRALVVR